jgi:hypothetical protein
MKSHRLPFENRWTGGEQAWHWYCELERVGVPNVRAMFADHELHHPMIGRSCSTFPQALCRTGLAFMIVKMVAGKPVG